MGSIAPLANATLARSAMRLAEFIWSQAQSIAMPATSNMVANGVAGRGPLEENSIQSQTDPPAIIKQAIKMPFFRAGLLFAELTSRLNLGEAR